MSQAQQSHAFEAQLAETPIRMLMSASPARLGDVRVDEAMSGEPYIVSPEAPLRSVVNTLSTRRLGAAIVVEHGEVQGVFTTTDALSILRGLLESSVSLG